MRKTIKAACRASLAGLFCLLSSGLSAQSLTVSGKVTGSTGESLAGVSVRVKGTNIGTTTNAAGEYAIQAPSTATLRFAVIGMAGQEVAIAGKTRIDVTMKEAETDIETVTVQVGYGSMEKKMLTSAVTSIAAGDLVQGVGGATVANALKGKVGNLVVAATDSPNADQTLQFRGMASLNASKDPLVVIDGMPGGDIRSIVQEDIQSIDILKDASAGAIYGTRATGGVILITTKRGQDGKLRVSYTGEATYKQNYSRPELMSLKEFKRAYPATLNFGGNTDWWEEALTDSPISNRHLLTVQGGSEYARIYANVMYDNNNGIMRGDKRKDYGGRINANFKMLDGWVELNTHVDYRQANRDKSFVSMPSILNLNPSRSAYDPTGPKGWNIWVEDDQGQNVIGDAALKTDNVLDKWFRPDAELKFNILPIKGLSLTVSGGYENRQAETYKFTSRNTTDMQRNKQGGEATLRFDKTDNLNSDSYLSYSCSFGNHSFDAVAGYSYYSHNSQYFEMYNKNFPIDDTKYWDMEKGTFLKEGDATMKSGKSPSEKLSAYFGRMNYNWQGRYMASASFRREGSSKFGRNNRYGNFWALSAGWRISDEEFMKPVKWMSDLKLRAGYGETGNEGFNATYANLMYGSDLFWMTPSTTNPKDYEWTVGYGVGGHTPNPDLKWEEKHEWNIGLDYALFDSRLFGKLDIYQRNVIGLINETKVPSPPNLVPKMYKNIGDLRNVGFEFEIGGKIVQSRNWDYETSINLSHNTTTVGKVIEGMNLTEGFINRQYVHRFEMGRQVGEFWVHEHAGFVPSIYVDGMYDFGAYTGDGTIVSSNGRLTEDGKKFVGNYTPTVMAGWTHSLRYKRLQFSATLTSWIDFDIFNSVQLYNGYRSYTADTQKNGPNRLASSMSKKNRYIMISDMPVTDYFIEDGTFLKIQNVSLSYTLPLRQFVKEIENVRVYLTVNNLYTFTKYSGVNPEVNITGWQNGIEVIDIYPPTRSWALGVTFNF
ncbi:MAG: SusC/RagA family TonB-linked outer membrane protein [Rikenellaceae bacterium]|nr:SusC/RagA family TonB-linked outer membrane protein [Rikenellaceae bacterium]